MFYLKTNKHLPKQKKTKAKKKKQIKLDEFLKLTAQKRFLLKQTTSN